MKIKMGNKIKIIGAGVILLLFLFSNTPLHAFEEGNRDLNNNIIEEDNNNPLVKIENNNEIAFTGTYITIDYPKVGYYYNIPKNIEQQRIFLQLLGFSMVYDSRLRVGATVIDVDHVEFKAKRMFLGTETTQTDNDLVDGVTCSLQLGTGFYILDAIAYNENNQEVERETMKIFFIKSLHDEVDFGLWLKTKYDSVEEEQKLNIGVADFIDMIINKEWKQYKIGLENPEDTTVNFRFTNDGTIFVEGEGEVNVFQTQFYMDTTCDTNKQCSVILEARFPFFTLNGDPGFDPSATIDPNEPYFCARVGFSSEDGRNGPKLVQSRFYFGKDNLRDPLVLKMEILPENAGVSDLTFSASLHTIDSLGDDAFRRSFNVIFEPALELKLTFIPRIAKTLYEFGESAGVPTKITFDMDGGVLDSLLYSIFVDPMPSYMSFDINLLHNGNLFEFLYDCSSTYNIQYSLESEQDDSFIKLEFEEVPRIIDFSVDLSILQDPTAEASVNLDMSNGISKCGLYMQGEKTSISAELIDLPSSFSTVLSFDLNIIGGVSASGLFDFDMSSDIGEVSVSVAGSDFSFDFEIQNFPKDIEITSLIDLSNGEGYVDVYWNSENDYPIFTTSITYKEWTIEGVLELKNEEVQLSWDIDMANRKGSIIFTRCASSGYTSFSTSISKSGSNGMTLLAAEFELKNTYLEISWDSDKDTREGYFMVDRSDEAEYSTLTVTVLYEDWTITNTFELKNEDELTIYWDLPTISDLHTELGLETIGGKTFQNTLSIKKGSEEILKLQLGLKTEDHFYIEWDFTPGGGINNFDWSGNVVKAISAYVKVNYDNFDFEIDFDWFLGDQAGTFEIKFNEGITIDLIDIQEDNYYLEITATVLADREFEFSWDAGDTGHFNFDTNGNTMGNQLTFEFGYDPDSNWNYKYGFAFVASGTISANNRRLDWWSGPLGFPHWQWSGTINANINLDVYLLWRYNWYQIL